MKRPFLQFQNNMYMRGFSLSLVRLTACLALGLSLSAQAQSPVSMLTADKAGGAAAQTATEPNLQTLRKALPAQLAQPLPTAALPAPLAPLEPIQFQAFVKDTTGQSLPLYGYKLFGNNFSPVTDLPVPANYVLGPGDEVSIQVWGAIDQSVTLTVDRNGQITLPKVGPLTVAGTRFDALEPLLRKHVGRVFNNFSLSATLGRLRSIQVFVVGQARQPGAYTVSSLSNLISALFESGGPAATGSMRNIQLVRAGKTVTTLDLYKFLHQGDTSNDTHLLPGDVIVIPPAGPRVALLGALDAPAIYELASPQETIAQLLTYSGGQQVLTSANKVLLERINPSQAKAPRMVEERSLSATGLQSTVRDGDVLTLFKISPEFANAVTLRGNVAEPLRYAFKPGMKVSDLIPEVGALIQPDYFTRKNIMVQFERDKTVSSDLVVAEAKTLIDEINWDFAAIHRLDKQALRTVLIPFNLGLAVKNLDPAHNLVLQPGDVVTVFGVKELPVPLEKLSQFVRVSGEVMVPGIYQIQGGETLPQIIQRAGGLSRNAFAYGTFFSRESTRLQQQENLNKSVRRLETEINAQSASTLQNVTDTEKGSALQAQLAGQKILLARLQTLKASGRIALELDAQNTVLPNITLENDDQISIPHRPSFVGVFGEVFTETSFIHKPGNTVSQYLDKAGITRDADVDNLLVVRADGTVESHARAQSFFSLNSGLLGKQLNPGDTVFVPAVIDRRTAYSKFIEGAKDWTTILYQFGIGVAALKTLRN
jgi:protein involved in polysaccharide export with SLBB domain